MPFESINEPVIAGSSIGDLTHPRSTPAPPPASEPDLAAAVDELKQLVGTAIGTANAASAASTDVRQLLDGLATHVATLDHDLSVVEAKGPASAPSGRWSDFLDRVLSRKFIVALGAEIPVIVATIGHAVPGQTGLVLGATIAGVYTVVEGIVDAVSAKQSSN